MSGMRGMSLLIWDECVRVRADCGRWKSTPLRGDKVVREKAWTEMVGVLEAKVPQVKEIAKL